jgi:hypothetical protein
MCPASSVDGRRVISGIVHVLKERLPLVATGALSDMCPNAQV